MTEAALPSHGKSRRPPPAPSKPQPTRSFLARLVRFFVVVIAVLLMFAVVVVLINLPDRGLSASASVWLKDAGSAPPEESPAAASLWALDAPARVDAAVAGRTLRAAYLAKTPEQIARGEWSITKPYQGEVFALPFELGCLDPASACVSSALAHSALVRQVADQHQVLLQRLDGLEQGRTIEELAPPAQPHAPAEQFAALVAGHSLELALASVDVGDAKVSEGLTRLERMTRLSRELLKGCETLACKLSASGMLRRSLLVYSELMNQTTAVNALNHSLIGVAGPLEPADLDLSPALAFEMRLAHNLDMSLAHASTSSAANGREVLAVRAAPLFFKQDATFNLQSELADIEAPMIKASAASFEHDNAEVFAHFERRAELIGAFSLASLYNPLGRILASGTPSLKQAAAQLHDVEALQMGVRAKGLLLEQGTRIADTQAVLDQQPSGLFDPYTEKPLQFDAQSSSILLTQRGSRPVAKLRVGLNP